MLGNCALASPVTSLTGDHVMQIGFGQILPSASSTRDLRTRLLNQLCPSVDWQHVFNKELYMTVIIANLV